MGRNIAVVAVAGLFSLPLLARGSNAPSVDPSTREWTRGPAMTDASLVADLRSLVTLSGRADLSGVNVHRETATQPAKPTTAAPAEVAPPTNGQSR